MHFQHEKELRFFFQYRYEDINRMYHTGKKIEVDLENLIEKIIISPISNLIDVDFIKYILEKFGKDKLKNKVKKSYFDRTNIYL